MNIARAGLSSRRGRVAVTAADEELN